MKALIALFLLYIPFSVTYAQEHGDSLFVVKKDGNWEIKYTVKAGETQRMLAKRFYITEGQLERANDESTMQKLNEGSTLYIPVTKDNFYVIKPPKLSSKNIVEMYYHVVPKDEIAILANYSGVTKNEMREWNALKGNTLTPGMALFIGWIKMVVKDSTDPVAMATYPVPSHPYIVDTTGNEPVPGGLDTVYNRQTNNGLNVLTEKGTAVFFDKPGRSTMYYAFHNEAARGSILKVFNPGSGKTTYVKVLGPLPDTRLYANCIVGISSTAKEALGVVNDAKVWCELSYAAD